MKLRYQQALAAIKAEVARAERLHPAWPADPWVRLDVLAEEVGEVSRARLDGSPPRELVAELSQVGAVAMRWLASLGDGIADVPIPPAKPMPGALVGALGAVARVLMGGASTPGWRVAEYVRTVVAVAASDMCTVEIVDGYGGGPDASP